MTKPTTARATGQASETRDQLKKQLEALIERFLEAEAAASKEALAPAANVPVSSTIMLSKPLPRPAGGRPPTSQHPFPQRVGNVTEWARQNGLTMSSVKTWFSGGSTIRPIPRKWAAVLLHTHQIPLDAWRGGITDNVSAGKPQPRGKERGRHGKRARR